MNDRYENIRKAQQSIAEMKHCFCGDCYFSDSCDIRDAEADMWSKSSIDLQEFVLATDGGPDGRVRENFICTPSPVLIPAPKTR